MTADSQSSSQEGDISRYKKMELITPTEKEARLCVLDNEIGIESLIKKIKEKSMSKNVILKLGSEGIVILQEKNKKVKIDRVPSIKNNATIDVSGAGDAMMTISSMSLAAKANIWEASFLGSLASSIAIGKYGNVPIALIELIKNLKNR